MLKCCCRALEKCMELYRQKAINPIRPLLTYEAENAVEAFTALQSADHIGKVILRIPKNTSSIPKVQSTRSLALDPRGSYLLAGGLGGLGRSVATWLVEQGARNLVFLSRNAGANESDQSFFKELISMGCEVSAVAGMTQNISDVKKAVSTASGPIKGVIQLAMVLMVCRSYSKGEKQTLAPIDVRVG